jgi:hypothetical protein
MKMYLVSGGIAPRIILGSRWVWMVSFTLWPHYSGEKSPMPTFDRRLDGPQNRPGRGGEEKKSQPPRGIEPRSSSPY